LRTLKNFCTRLAPGTTCGPFGRSVRGTRSSSGRSALTLLAEAAKAVTKAEIVKRRFKGLHQITKVGSQEIVDEYEPLEEGLDKVTDTRSLPSIEIKLSKDALDTSDKGYQAPLDESMVTEVDPEEMMKSRGRGKGQGKGAACRLLHGSCAWPQPCRCRKRDHRHRRRSAAAHRQQRRALRG